MPVQTTNLFLLEDLDDSGRTSALARSDVEALRATAEWIKDYVIKPHQDLGRAGPVCPFVPRSLERRVLWLAPEHVGDRDAPGVAEVISNYRRLLLDTQRDDDEDVAHEVIVVVFPDLSADRAQVVFDDVLQRLAVPQYAESGIVFGPFYAGHQGTAIYNSSFHPFRSPVPFMFLRHGVVGDWKFFLDNAELFDAWALRFGEAGAHVLAEELRHMPWRVNRG